MCALDWFWVLCVGVWVFADVHLLWISFWSFLLVVYGCGFLWLGAGWLLCDWRVVLLIGAGLGCWVCCVVVAFG